MRNSREQDITEGTEIEEREILGVGRGRGGGGGGGGGGEEREMVIKGGRRGR